MQAPVWPSLAKRFLSRKTLKGEENSCHIGTSFLFLQNQFHRSQKKEKCMENDINAPSTSPKTLRDIADRLRMILWIVWRLAADQRSKLVYGYLTVVALEGTGMLAAWVVSRLMSQIVKQGDLFRWQNALGWIGALYLVWLMWLVMDVLRDYVTNAFRNELDRHLPLLAVEKMLSLSRAFHQSHNVSELASKVTRGSVNVSAVLDLLQFNILTRVTFIMGTVAILFFMHWSLALLALVSLVTDIYFMLLGRLDSVKPYDERFEIQSKVEERTGEAVANALTIQANGCEAEILKQIKMQRDKMFELRRTQSVINMKSWTRLGFIQNQIQWMMIATAVYLVSRHVYSVSTLVFVVSVSIRYREELFQFGWIYDSLMEMFDSIFRFWMTMQEKPTILDPRTPKPLPASTQAEIEFRDVSFSYRPAENPEETRWALRDVSFKLKRGSVLGIAGLSGGGKSTLINLLLRLDDPTIGEVLFNGVPLNQVRLQELRERIGYVEQQPRLSNNTIAENIAFGRTCTQDEIIEAAKIAGAHDFIMEMERGYETNALDRGARLSGGQMQRIAIARAVLRKASLLILDEPTSSIDPYSISRIMDALERLKGSCTIVLVSHQLATLQRLADDLIVVKGGRIVEAGTHEQLMKHNGLYAELVEIQQHEDRLS